MARHRSRRGDRLSERSDPPTRLDEADREPELEVTEPKGTRLTVLCAVFPANQPLLAAPFEDPKGSMSMIMVPCAVELGVIRATRSAP